MISEEWLAELRPTLVRHAYHMLGTMSDAEDIVQDAFERLTRVKPQHVRDERAYVRTTVTNLALDRLRARARSRETYVGPWLPEPVVTDETAVPEAALEIAEDVSFAFLLALERLSPLERAAFLLHDALDVPFAEIAQTLGRSEESVRRLASRARVAVRRSQPRRIPRTDAEAARERMGAAILSGDVETLMHLLTDDCVLLSDGGGKKAAAINPLVGPDRVARFLVGVAKKSQRAIRAIVPTWVNASPGWALFGEDGLDQTIAFEIGPDGVEAIYIVRNPDKLAHAREAFPP